MTQPGLVKVGSEAFVVISGEERLPPGRAARTTKRTLELLEATFATTSGSSAWEKSRGKQSKKRREILAGAVKSGAHQLHVAPCKSHARENSASQPHGAHLNFAAATCGLETTVGNEQIQAMPIIAEFYRTALVESICDPGLALVFQLRSQ